MWLPCKASKGGAFQLGTLPSETKSEFLRKEKRGNGYWGGSKQCLPCEKYLTDVGGETAASEVLLGWKWILGALGTTAAIFHHKGGKEMQPLSQASLGSASISIIMEKERMAVREQKGLCPCPSTGSWNPVSLGKSLVDSQVVWNAILTGGDLRAVADTGFGMERQQWASGDTWGCWECLKIIQPLGLTLESIIRNAG